MAVVPFATFMPITVPKYYDANGKLTIVNKTLTAKNRLNMHITDGHMTGEELHSFFNHSTNADSTFYIDQNGKLYQYRDTKYRANADLDGNDASYSCETWGKAGDKWNSKMIDTAARLFAWLVLNEGVKNQLCTNAFVGKDSSKGLGHHRHGVDGNFPKNSILSGRLQLGPNNASNMHYSKAFGKLCPTDENVPLVKTIWEQAQAYIKGDKPNPKPPTPNPKPPTPKPDPKPVKTPDVDGWWGSETTKIAQDVYGTHVDGTISGQNVAYKKDNPGCDGGWKWESDPAKMTGSQLILAMQKDYQKEGLYKGDLDGLAGPKFFTAMSQHYGIKSPDGTLSGPSDTVKKFQTDLQDRKV